MRRKFAAFLKIAEYCPRSESVADSFARLCEHTSLRKGYMKRFPRMCAVCKQPIEAERAEGFKETRLCLAHAQEIRRLGGEFHLLAKQEMLNKKESFKKNPGGVRTRLVRNQAAIDRLRREFVDRKAAATAAAANAV